MEEKRQVFEKLLDAYTASLRTLAQAQLQVNNPSAEITKLKGNFSTIYVLSLTKHVLISSCSLLASIPMVDDLQGRIAELTADLDQYGPALAKAKEQATRLQGVENDL